jgi:hypothetical protein
MTSQSSDGPILACNLQAIPQDQRPQHQARTEQLFAASQEVRELATGYALRLPGETEILQTIADFIRYERLCCPFLHFVVEVEPEQGPIWLHLMGKGEDVKPILASIVQHS